MATRIAKPIISADHVDIDEASGLPVANEKISVFCDLDEMNFLSPAYPMYFQYLKFCGYLLLTILLLSGMYNLYSNAQGTACIPEEDIPEPVTKEYLETHCILNFVTKYSVANKITDDRLMDNQDILNLFTIIGLIVLMQYLRKVQKETALICDERAITASDFTAKVMNIPKDFSGSEHIEETIKNWFQNNGLPGTHLDIQKINICYDVTEKIETVKETEKLILQKLDLEKRKKEGKLVSDDELENLKKQIQNQFKKIDRINMEYRTGALSKFTGECFITFQTQQELQAVLNYWNIPKSQKELEEFNPYSPYKFRDSVLVVQQAPEPTDVLWENAGFSKREKTIRRITTFLATILVLACSFVVIYYFSSKQDEIWALEAEEETTFWEIIGLETLSQLASVLIIVINLFLDNWMDDFTNYEKYSTFSENQANYTIKSALAQFFNTTVISLLISLKSGNLWGENGLTTSVYAIFRNDAIIPPLVGILDFNFIIASWRRQWYREHMDTAVIIQKDLIAQQNCLLEQNESEFEYPQFVFAYRYSYYIKTLLSAAFYAPLVPAILVWVCFGFCLKYWLDKYILLNRRARGKSMGPELPQLLMEMLEWPVILFAAGNLFFSMYAENMTISELIPTLVGAGLGLLNAVLPMAEINDRFFPVRDEKVTDDKYSEIRIKFIEDYDRANPATGELALEKYSKERQGAVSH